MNSLYSNEIHWSKENVFIFTERVAKMGPVLVEFVIIKDQLAGLQVIITKSESISTKISSSLRVK